VDGTGRDVEWQGERGIKKKPTYNCNLKMITGERGIKKKSQLITLT